MMMVKFRLAILALLIISAIVGLLVAHYRHLENLPKEPRFVRFMRRYSKRDNVVGVIPQHGKTLDRFGNVIEVAESGSRFEAVVDDIALSSGGVVKLSLDAGLQNVAAQLMQGKKGAVVAMEPSTGKIRVLVSSPSLAWLNRALDGLYPPGSTFKIFTAATALSSGIDPILNCSASGYKSSRGTPAIRDSQALAAQRRGTTWKGFGKIGMGEAMCHSSNVYFAQLGVMLGTENFEQKVQSSRLRDSVEVMRGQSISLVSSANGIPEGLRPAALAPVAIGQGALQLTPLAVAMVTVAIANDGIMLNPTLLQNVKPELRARLFDYGAAQRVKKMMRGVVLAGTGKACEIKGLNVCAKTGTAETGRGVDHAWFTCFAPEKNPRLVVTVLVEEGGFGAKAALPVAKALLVEAERAGYFK